MREEFDTYTVMYLTFEWTHTGNIYIYLSSFDHGMFHLAWGIDKWPITGFVLETIHLYL